MPQGDQLPATVPQMANGGPADTPSLDAAATIPTNWDTAFAAKFQGMDREGVKATFLQSASDTTLEYFCDQLGVDHSGYKPGSKPRAMKTAIIAKIFKKGTDEIKL